MSFFSVCNWLFSNCIAAEDVSNVRRWNRCAGIAVSDLGFASGNGQSGHSHPSQPYPIDHLDKYISSSTPLQETAGIVWRCCQSVALVNQSGRNTSLELLDMPKTPMLAQHIP